MKKILPIKDSLEKRNKLICIADCSPGGWGSVSEYLSDELASDSEDEKKLRAAENHALAKSKTTSRFRKPSRTSTISNTQSQPFCGQSISDRFLGRPFFA